MVDLLSEKNKSKIQIFLIIIGFLLFIMLSNNLFKGFRFDLTENKLYTLGEGTYNIINKILFMIPSYSIILTFIALCFNLTSVLVFLVA